MKKKQNKIHNIFNFRYDRSIKFLEHQYPSFGMRYKIFQRYLYCMGGWEIHS
jgi:hypothetical protein